MKFVKMPKGAIQGKQAQYESFQASQLHCPTCKGPMPVREQVALYLPGGNIYHYKCARCGSVLGKKQD